MELYWILALCRPHTRWSDCPIQSYKHKVRSYRQRQISYYEIKTQWLYIGNVTDIPFNYNLLVQVLLSIGGKYFWDSRYSPGMSIVGKKGKHTNGISVNSSKDKTVSP